MVAEQFLSRSPDINPNDNQPAGGPGGLVIRCLHRRILTEWAHQDSNLGPRDYESPALTAEL